MIDDHRLTQEAVEGNFHRFFDGAGLLTPFNIPLKLLLVWHGPCIYWV